MTPNPVERARGIRTEREDIILPAEHFALWCLDLGALHPPHVSDIGAMPRICLGAMDPLLRNVAIAFAIRRTRTCTINITSHAAAASKRLIRGGGGSGEIVFLPSLFAHVRRD